MRKLGEQWVENGRMYKAVEGPKIVNGLMEGNTCHGCCYVDNWDDDCLNPTDCPVGKGVVVKDLGPVNEDGCLPSPWGGYPKIARVGSEGFCTYKLRFYLKNEGVYGFTLIEVTGNTRQEVIDAWNRRA